MDLFLADISWTMSPMPMLGYNIKSDILFHPHTWFATQLATWLANMQNGYLPTELANLLAGC